jgi:FKBP-type peptidyl-prolyl cis-trans isomerase FkpA
MQFSFRPGVARHLALGVGALSIASFLASCNSGGGDFAKTKSGIEYKIFKKENGKYTSRTLTDNADPTFKDRQGKFLLAHVAYLTGKDSMLQSSRQQLANHPLPLPLMPLDAKNKQTEALAMVQPGDSAVFRFRADSLFKPRPVPPELKRGGGYLVMQVVGVKVIDQAEAMAMQQELQQIAASEQQRQMRAYAADQDKKDEVTLQDYIKKNNLTGAKKSTTGSGVYIQTTQPGTGSNAKAGQLVSVKYRGTLLNGQEFDSSAKQGGTPFTFPLGRGGVIPGWDDALTQLSKGAKATILIPSSLAYGKTGSPPAIPANSPLRFDIEVVDIKDAPKMPAMSMTPPTAAPAQ